MPIYPYSFQLPPLNVQDIPNDGAPGEFLGINVGGALDWLPAGGGGGSGDMLAANNLSELTNFATARTNIGLGTASTPTFANLTLTSPSLSSSAPVTISQTWGAVGQTFTAFKVNAAGTSDANSAAGSLLADFQVNGVSKALIAKSGVLVANTFALGGDYPVGITRIGDGGLRFIRSNVAGAGFSGIAPILDVAYDGIDFFLNLVNVAATLRFGSDTRLQRDGAANTLALRNGEAPQTFRLYNTYSAGGVNFERLNIQWSGGAARIFPDAGGTGTLKTVYLGSDSVANNAFLVNGASNLVQINTSGVERMRITSAGNVGIGTTAPSEKLHVLGGKVLFGDATDATGTAGNGDLTLRAYRSPQIHISANASSSVLYGLNIELNNNIYAGLLLNLNSGEVKIGGLSVGGYFPTFYADNVERMRITAAGNVGIGTTSPTSKLDVAGAVSAGSSSAGYQLTNGTIRVSGWGNNQGSSLGGLGLSSSFVLGWASGADGGNFGLLDTILLRDEQYHLALRNGTNGQKFSVYGTYPGAAWERFTITAPTSGNVLLGTYKGTGGIARGLEFQTDGVTRMRIDSGGLITFISALGTFSASGNSTFQNIFLADSAVYGYANNLGTGIKFASDGVGQLRDNAGTSFNRLQFGGTTDSFPAIARDGAGIKFTGAAAGSTSWIKVPPVAVSALPLAATAGAGARAFVNDASSPTFGSAVTGGGAVLVPVYSTGSAWNVG